MEQKRGSRTKANRMKVKSEYPGLGYPFEMKYHHGKNVSLSVYPNNRIILRSPRRISQKFILEFLDERKSWVREQYLKNLSQNPKKTDFQENEILPIFGKNRKIIFSKTENSEITPESIILNVKGLRSEKGRVLRAKNLLRQEIEKQARPLILKYCSKIGTTKYSLNVKTMRSLWGSCSPKNKITLNLALIFCPEFVFEYVIVHEVSHTKERNHSKKFWEVLSSLYPNYLKAERWIKENGKKVLCYLY